MCKEIWLAVLFVVFLVFTGIGLYLSAKAIDLEHRSTSKED
jgi:hypothetical protein